MGNIKTTLKNYRKNKLKISVAQKHNKMTSELEGILREMEAIDMGLEYLKEDLQNIIDRYYRKGDSYESLARSTGYTKAGVVSKVKRAVNELQKMFD